MKIISPFLLLTAVVGSALLATQSAGAQSPRKHLSLDALSRVNSGTGRGPASEIFSDSYWQAVNLPHDWAAELPFYQAADGGHGLQTTVRTE